MPTLSSATTGSTGLAFEVMRRSLSLPAATLQPEITEENRGKKERHHRDGDRRALAQLAAGNGPLEAQGRHEVGCIERPTTRQHVDELKIREGEQHREGHYHGDQGREHG